MANKIIGGIICTIIGSALVLFGLALGTSPIYIKEISDAGSIATNVIVGLISLVIGFFLGKKGINLLREARKIANKIAYEKERVEAAEKGGPKAQFDLGVIYMGEYRLSEAKQWLEKALKQGYSEAEAKLKECDSRLKEAAERAARAAATRSSSSSSSGWDAWAASRDGPHTCGNCTMWLSRGVCRRDGSPMSAGDSCSNWY